MNNRYKQGWLKMVDKLAVVPGHLFRWSIEDPDKSFLFSLMNGEIIFCKPQSMVDFNGLYMMLTWKN